MLYTRMLFSCLVDADYTASSHTPPEEGPPLDVSTALKNLYDHCKALRKHSGADPVLNQYRTRLFERCGQSGEQNGGLFTLTAPTGTGKTLALLHFALRHCQHTGKHRIIVVLPFLSLIEQSAGVYRKILPHVMEDHSQSQLPEEMRDHAARWDQPFLITTSVRFFESLFSDHPTDCRKLHNLANSVILFDEAQSLPVSLLSPTLKVIEELCTRYGCSVVFSTATQPDYTGLREINWSASELLPEHSEFYRALRRTAAHWEIDTPTPLEEIAERMAQHQNVCTIVNLRAHARTLYQALARLCPEEEVFLLSTDLCPAHRTEVIQAIHRRQKEKLPCRVVSTQCIEAGVDLDFERIPAADRERYPSFLQHLSDAVAPDGYKVRAAVAAKNSDNASSRWVEGLDYAAIGKAVSAVLLMTYDYGYASGPAQAVAPLPQVRETLRYAVTRIPREKILLGIPNYGYNWPLPYEAGKTRARSVTNEEAIDLARTAGVAIQYDEQAQAPWFRYTEDGTQREVWFEDARSLRAKLRLAVQFGLRGVGFWNLSRPFRQGWTVLSALVCFET